MNLTADLSAFASLTREQICRAENIGLKALERLHRRGEAPLRYKSGRRWIYPAIEYLAWRQKKLSEAAQTTARQRKRREAEAARQRKTEAEVAALERMTAE